MDPDNSIAESAWGETYLDPEIQFPHPVSARIGEPGRVFLTGATGLLGVNLLGELLRTTGAEVQCLVRARSAREGFLRITRQLMSYEVWDDAFEARIAPIVGDLAEPRFGLSESGFRALAEGADTIYHCGAEVNLLYPYKRLKATNVSSTQEVLRLAGLYRTKPVHYVSSLAVFSRASNFSENRGIVLETDNPKHDRTCRSGYIETKVVSEKLVQAAMERGLPACIYRTGRLAGRSDNGIMASLSDLICVYWRACVVMECCPRVDARLKLIPVDFASRAIAYLSRRPRSMGKVFHIENPHSIAWTEIFEATRTLGYRLESLPDDEWFAAVKRHAEVIQRDARMVEIEKSAVDLTSIAHFGPMVFTQRNSRFFDMRQTLKGLSDTAIRCQPIDSRLLLSYMLHFERCGYFPKVPLPKWKYWQIVSKAQRGRTAAGRSGTRPISSSGSAMVDYWRARKRASQNRGDMA